MRWLSQSLTDSIKRKQEQAAEFLRSCARCVGVSCIGRELMFREFLSWEFHFPAAEDGVFSYFVVAGDYYDTLPGLGRYLVACPDVDLLAIKCSVWL